jgi:DNA-binding IclR family transcriptional regulator
VTPTDVAGDFDVALSTDHDYSSTLAKCGWLRNEGGDYSIRHKFLTIAGTWRRKIDFFDRGPGPVSAAVSSQPRISAAGRSSLHWQPANVST